MFLHLFSCTQQQLCNIKALVITCWIIFVFPWWLRQNTFYGYYAIWIVNPLRWHLRSSVSEICEGNFPVCGPVCVCPYQLCYISARSDKGLFEVMLVSGMSSLHHCYNRQNVEGSSLHFWLGKCLLIPAKMPGCFLVHIPQNHSSPINYSIAELWIFNVVL